MGQHGARPSTVCKLAADPEVRSQMPVAPASRYSPGGRGGLKEKPDENSERDKEIGF
jgi:hypothetical protein